MTWTVDITKSAEDDLGKLDPPVAKRIDKAIRKFAETGHGDVVRLQDSPDLRLRLGQWRVRFRRDPSTQERDAGVIVVLRVLHRREAYR